ncbi:S-layer homology domain-containing protein [Peptoniphilus grossensis]|uniref:S-layer homology domain-containing protein n=1 Tax=Peptoniphilus grossensis TaxID=1465756 RepID=UPI00399A5572
MKRSLSLLLALVMLIGILPFQVFADVESAELETKIEEIEEGAEEKSPLVQEEKEKEEDELQIGDEIKGAPLGAEPNVTLVGQWVNESTTKEDTPKHYELTDKIGYELFNSGLLRGKAKQFLGWSDKAPVGNGVLAEGAKLFSPEDTIADVFGSSIPKDAKIYAVYYEINKPYGDPLPTNPVALLVPGQLATEIKDRINDNKVMIDESLKAEDILKGTDNYSADGVIIDKYKKTDDDKTINEVVLNSELEMDWVAAMLAYKNIAGSNQILPILSRDYGERFENNDFPTDEGKAAGYTHVDLNMDFGKDEGLVVPDQLFLEFKSYSWRPLYAFGFKDDGTKDVLNGLDDYKDLVSNSDPRTKFSVKTKYKAADGKDKNYRKITIRVILRQWDPNDKNTNRGFTGERIPEFSIPKGPQGTVASEILSNMTLRVLGSADGIENKNIVRITDARANELANSEGKENITITGSIKGYMLSSLGTQQVGKFKIPLESDAEINEIKANELKLSYVHKKEEPNPIEKVVLTLDENHFDGKILTHELDKCEEVGKYLYSPSCEGYIFRGWNTKSDGSGDFVKASDLICESKTIYAIWEKEAVEHHHEYVPTLPVYADAKKDNVRPSESHSAYIFGYEDKSVRANNNLSRAEAAAMVTRLAKLDLSNKAKADYKDLQDKAWYLPYINAALKAGMIDADGENLRPNDKITRAEFAKMLAAIDKENDYVSKFEDVKGHKYEKEINKIDGNKRIAGYEDGTFRPDNNLTRAEAASFLNRMFNRVADDAAIRNLEDSLVKFTDLNKGDWFYYEIVEAANSHELVRRDGSDKYDRLYESWLRLIDNGITR